MIHWSLIVSALGVCVAVLGGYCGWILFPNMVHKKVEQVSLPKKKKCVEELHTTWRILMDKHESRPCVYVAYGLMGSTMIFTKKKKAYKNKF